MYSYFLDNKKSINIIYYLKLKNFYNSQKVKILGSGDLKDKIILEVDFISKSVKAKLDKTGSTLKIKK